MSKSASTSPIRKAVFPAAGLGTRFLPATKAQPKEMLPIVDKPVIQYVIEEAVDSGITDIIIVTGRGKNAIEDHFDVSFELERVLAERGQSEQLRLVREISDMIRVSYVRQKEALGLGHAVLVARALIGDEPFAVFLGDDVIDAKVPCMRQMIEAYKKKNASIIALEAVDPARTKDYGVIAGKPAGGSLYRLTDLVEKPPPEEAPSNLAIIGRYILTPEVFDHLERVQPDRKGERQLTDGLRSLLREQAIYGYRFSGKRYDTGNKLGFLKATVEFALKREDLGGEFREYLRGVDLDAGSSTRVRTSRSGRRKSPSHR
ncbi:MAG: UTP--glucose-1-phosphate uridylyltransferase GalU [Acidobacteria bacterium]|nr:UTP--glucose-1-phosphate uridylyltransferase GalU [Acidobacteriota bacterium]